MHFSVKLVVKNQHDNKTKKSVFLSLALLAEHVLHFRIRAVHTFTYFHGCLGGMSMSWMV